MLDNRHSSWDQARRRTDQESSLELFGIMVLVRCSLSCVQLSYRRLTFLLSSGNLLSIVFVLGQPLHLLLYSHRHSSLLFFFYFLVRLCSAKCPPRISRKEATAKHAQRDFVSWRVDVCCLSYRFCHPRETNPPGPPRATWTGRS
jgi:hypothetical protein